MCGGELGPRPKEVEDLARSPSNCKAEPEEPALFSSNGGEILFLTCPLSQAWDRMESSPPSSWPHWAAHVLD